MAAFDEPVRRVLGEIKVGDYGNEVKRERKCTAMSTAAIERVTVGEIQRDQHAIFSLMKDAMKEGQDYGIMPGAKKPSLYKPGSEKILSLFKLGVDVLVEEVTPTSNIGRFDEYRVRVYVTLKEMGSGRFIGKGIGECSSFEEKYMWRAASGPQELDYYQKQSPDYVRLKFKQEWSNGRPTGREMHESQVRVPTADRMNTVLKMAKKRAQIDATLTATAASAIFTQDLEDIPDYLRDAIEENQEHQEPAPAKPQRPQRKSESEKASDSKKTEDKDRDPECITGPQERMLWAISNKVKLSEDEVHAKLKAEFKDKTGQPLSHTKDMLRKDLGVYLDSVDPEFKYHDRPKN